MRVRIAFSVFWGDLANSPISAEIFNFGDFDPKELKKARARPFRCDDIRAGSEIRSSAHQAPERDCEGSAVVNGRVVGVGICELRKTWNLSYVLVNHHKAYKLTPPLEQPPKTPGSVGGTTKKADGEFPHCQTALCSCSPTLKPSMWLIHRAPPLAVAKSEILQVCSGSLASGQYPEPQTDIRVGFHLGFQWIHHQMAILEPPNWVIRTRKPSMAGR